MPPASKAEWVSARGPNHREINCKGKPQNDDPIRLLG